MADGGGVAGPVEESSKRDPLSLYQICLKELVRSSRYPKNLRFLPSSVIIDLLQTVSPVRIWSVCARWPPSVTFTLILAPCLVISVKQLVGHSRAKWLYLSHRPISVSIRRQQLGAVFITKSWSSHVLPVAVCSTDHISMR